jgi:hypothetical protein
MGLCSRQLRIWSVCLPFFVMREIGTDTDQIEALLTAHYQSWPIA